MKKFWKKYLLEEWYANLAFGLMFALLIAAAVLVITTKPNNYKPIKTKQHGYNSNK